MSGRLSIHRIHYDENPMLRKAYLDGISYADALENAYEQVELAWGARVREDKQNDQNWEEFYEARARTRKEIGGLKRQIAALERKGNRQSDLRHAYRYRASALADLGDELEIEELESQIQALLTENKQRLVRAERTGRREEHRRFNIILNDYKEIIVQYCKRRIKELDPEFSPDEPIKFQWKWDLGVISVYYGGNGHNTHEDGHGHAEFLTKNLRLVYLRPAFWEHSDWLVRNSRFKDHSIIAEEWPKERVEIIA